MKRKLFFSLGTFAATFGILHVPIGGSPPPVDNKKVEGMDLSSYSAAAPATPLDMLFIHHSCGGQLLAEPGAESERGHRCIYDAHPNGGGLRRLLAAQGYEVHEASYGSEIGDKTDAFDWAPKFRDKLDTMLSVETNDVMLTAGKKNRIVVWKSCYTENRFTGEGEPPGSPTGPDKTLWNYKAHMKQVLEELKKHPDVLFVYVTPPPLSPVVPKERLWKYALKSILGRPHAADVLARQGSIARKYNEWIVAPDGWLAGYPEKNVVVFDYYGVLTDFGASNLSRYAADDGDDHPLRSGNEKAAQAFVPFLNRAVRRAGLVP